MLAVTSISSYVMLFKFQKKGMLFSRKIREIVLIFHFHGKIREIVLIFHFHGKIREILFINILFSRKNS